MNFDEWYEKTKPKYYSDGDAILELVLREAKRIAYNAAMCEAAKLYQKYEGKKFMDEIELIYDSDWQAHVTADANSNYLPIVGDGGYIFNKAGNDYSTPTMDVANARSCYENLRNFFNRQECA